MTNETIQIGDTVRSFDFKRFSDLRGPEAYYVEGVVTDIISDNGSQRIVIDVTRDVHEGRVIVPGRRQVGVGLTDSVVLVAVGL